MAANPLFDLQASVADLDVASMAFAAPLTGLGFARRPYERDHAPAGRRDDERAWAKRFWTRTAPHPEPVNLHVRVAGAANERLALLFRDWFRAHPLAVPAYGRFKVALAEVVETSTRMPRSRTPWSMSWRSRRGSGRRPQAGRYGDRGGSPPAAVVCVRGQLEADRAVWSPRRQPGADAPFPSVDGDVWGRSGAARTSLNATRP
jgi:hypothetical protein